MTAIWATAFGTAAVTGFALWLSDSRSTDQGDPTAAITARSRGVAATGTPPIRFRDVTAAMGVVVRHGPGPRSRALPEDTGSGIAWGDYDADGDPDLYVVNFPSPLGQPPDPSGTNRLFRNDGDRFADVTDAAGVGDLNGFGMGATFADYDSDADVDLYVTNFGPNRLYRNRGDGTFEDVAAAAGVDDSLWSTGAVWGDFDRDGELDLYVCNYVDYRVAGLIEEPSMDVSGFYTIPYTLNPNSFDPQPNRLYRNRGGGSFEDVAEQCRVSNPNGRSLGATFCDLDGDGWLDLYVANDVSTNRLFRNTGDDLGGAGLPVFLDLSTATGTADPRGSMGISVGEIGGMSGNSDNLPDLFITHWVAQENALYQSLRTGRGVVEYRDKSRQFRLGEISTDAVGWGSVLADFDLDGRVDIAVANGSTLERAEDPLRLVEEPMFLFWNDGKRFHNIAPRSGETLSRPYSARGLAAADFDGDGDIDLAVSVNRGRPLLLRNETDTANRSLSVSLRGKPTACIGARVEVVVHGKSQIQWLGADATFLGMHSPDLVFGLGDHDAADRLCVRWADGTETARANLHPGRVVVVHPDTSTALTRRF
ncbi:MAG: CRTAC1 family protein [Candidatus Latescibacteria bacterium]|nr:CRTAC1 family protein [Candidatus Latescibacterota bacterium]